MNESKRLFLSVLALLILGGCYSQRGDITSSYIDFSPCKPTEVKVMTFNIRAKTIMDGLHSWHFRKYSVYDKLVDNAADVIGLQEVKYSQLYQIREILPQYSYYAAGRSDGELDGESCPIFYRTDRFVMLDSGTFWFSDTPDVAGTRDWGNIVPRICSWVHLLEKGKDTSFYVYNLHLACFSQNSREKSAQLLAKRVSERETKDSFVVMGDYNMPLHNPAMMYLMKFGYRTPYPRMVDAWLSVSHDSSGASTRQSFGGRILGPKIDHIQISECAEAVEVTIDDRKMDGRYGSDHFPVIAKIVPASSPQVTRLDHKRYLFAETVLQP